ncbi:penicillin-binding protein 2 [Peribacillus saganii]|uniref:serine-type D-Ala-D-Ala carboxypeptidase n=1 Tax=Peribacillus saganii TaxID=2303992 RepID=A0A372LU92_9BACI|nr:penicillin-binding transpeptidase domain-containing protein [Peribacillus saganii]RFU71636.1 penicillin-binding protein 2 [Peribacillus saganii]
MIQKRMKSLAILLVLLLLSLTGRLVQIQLVSTESFSDHNVNLIESSVKQRTQVMKIDDGRGDFYDKNGRPLSHEVIPVLVLFPFLNKMDWPAEKVANIINEPEYLLRYELKAAKEPFAFGGKTPLKLTEEQSQAINDLKIPGVFAVKQKLEHDGTMAEHLIGTLTKSDELKAKSYPNRGLSPDTYIGITGLQHTFDEFLLSEGESKLVFHVDGSGGPLFGVDVKYVEPANPMYPVKVITTLDSDIQAAAEKLVDRHGIRKGGLVLIDIEKSEIAAIVSRPKINQRNPNENSGSKNRMLMQDTPGSVFKTVTAAAAIEHDLVPPGRTFNCDETIDGKKEPKKKLGTLDFEKSFSQSCNRTFGDLAKEMTDIDPDFLLSYGSKLGLIGQTGWQGEKYHSNFKQLDKEESGRVWNDKAVKKDKKLAAHAAIGQQDVQVTPLAVANMMATIARGGEKRMVTAVRKVSFNNGTTAIDFPAKEMEGERISPYTAMKLQSLLRSVVTEPKGTGASLSQLPYEIAGKSGTAQTGIDKRELNKWFAGYFPYKNPKYALVTVKLDSNDQEAGVTSLFKEMVEEIYRIETSSPVPD